MWGRRTVQQRGDEARSHQAAAGPWQDGRGQEHPGPAQGWDDVTALEQLRTAGMVAFGGVGFAGIKGPATLAYEFLRDAGARVQPQLQALLTSATPEGKVYAAHLLTGVDPAHGRAVWRWLADQPAELHIGSGCLLSSGTLADYAREQLARLPPDGGFTPSA